MKKYNNREVYVVKYTFNEDKEINEKEFLKVFDSIEKRD